MTKEAHPTLPAMTRPAWGLPRAQRLPGAKRPPAERPLDAVADGGLAIAVVIRRAARNIWPLHWPQTMAADNLLLEEAGDDGRDRARIDWVSIFY
jgi:hypothetical protein